MSEFTHEEEKILLKFVTNTNKNIFCLVNLPEVVKGALFSRYSRSTKSMKRVLLDEFILNKEIDFNKPGEIPQIVATQKAEEFYERVLVGFGDDSVAELAGVHVAIENISNIATKFIEDSRIGLSPLEKSTRYVYFDEKKDGKYLYCREPKIMNSEFAEIYEETCDLLFDSYSKLISKISKFFEEKYPKESNISERAYTSTIRAKTCDVLRGLLPASTLTNMGIFGNGRAFEYLLTKLYANNLDEIKYIASELHEELRMVIPTFVKRTDDKYGKIHIEYISETEKNTREIVNNIVKNNKCEHENYKPELVELVDYDKDGELKVVSAIIYSNSDISMLNAQKIAKYLLESAKNTIIKELILAYTGKRQNRRHKPYRAFENTYYTFDICSNFGAYRDIHRHRILTQQRQLLSTNLGYDLPKEIVDAGYEKEFCEAMQAAKNAHEKIAEKMPEQAQYVVPFAYRLRWYMKMNLREGYHLAELRSVQQGHSDYRKIAQEIYRKINSVHPNLVEGMKFVDMQNYELERLEAEKKIDEKIKKMNNLKI